MTTWIKCPKCRGEVGISDNSDSDVLCPRCREPVLLVDPETKTGWMPGKAAHSWTRPCGWILVSIAIFMMLYSVLREAGHRNPSLLVVLFEYVTDPFILVGMPLGIYWIRRAGSTARVNDRPILPVKHATPTIANSITTDSAPTGNSAALALFYLVAFFGAFAVMLAILNSSTASNRKRDFDKAIADYSEAIRLNPTYAIAYNNRGHAWYAKNDFGKAIADYSEAIRLNPTYALAYWNRGIAWQGKNDFDKAIADYSEAIRLNPRNTMAFSYRGNAWFEKGQVDKANADLTEAIRLDPRVRKSIIVIH
jgi:TPR repeat/Tetratricopeptide repeat